MVERIYSLPERTNKEELRAKLRSLDGEYFLNTDILEEMFIPGVIRILYRYLYGKETLVLDSPGDLPTIPDLDLDRDSSKTVAIVIYATKTRAGHFYIGISEQPDCFRVTEQPALLEPDRFFSGCDYWKPLRKLIIPDLEETDD